MSCKEIAENVTYTTELIREIKAQTFRYFLALIVSIFCCLCLVGYIFYDRYLDSKFEYEETIETVGILQDGEGYNNFIHGTGDIINGTEDNNNEKDEKEQGQ